MPIAAGFLAALLFWSTRHGMMGNIVGSGFVLAGAVMAIYREAATMMATRSECARLQTPCRFTPDDFTRHAIYAGIAFFQIFLLFMIGLFFEERQRRRQRAKAWR